MEVLLERSPGSGKDSIGYHALTQAAYRGIVRAATRWRIDRAQGRASS